jgi:hypothetical protein
MGILGGGGKVVWPLLAFIQYIICLSIMLSNSCPTVKEVDYHGKSGFAPE